MKTMMTNPSRVPQVRVGVFDGVIVTFADTFEGITEGFVGDTVVIGR